MAGNIFGELFKVVSFGESHGPALGCVIDGCPAGLELAVEDISRELRRRRPAQGVASTSRREDDEPEILSGVFEGKTLGTPIAIMVRNTDCHSTDYDNLRNVYRPGHADFCWEAKYGIRDHRGGGRSSGRETLCRVAAGAVAKKLLANYSIRITAWTSALAGLEMPRPGSPEFDFDEIEQNPLRIPGRAAAEQALKAIEALRAEGDSAGGIVSCLAQGVPPGLGEPVFGKLDARLASAMLSLGAVKGIEFGAGFAAAGLKGSENNDTPVNKTNNAGGILGGISSGQDITFNVAFKPTPSIAKPQKAIGKADGKADGTANGEIIDLIISGRHDACIPPRAVPVVEAMTALVLADLVLLQRAARVL
ncbi:MAG: chorismate synthase [Treponema sp.]|nr:chorismate synthase [Treponema sp.]